MKNTIILHGMPEKEHYYDPKKPSESNAHWLPWLQKELIIRDIKADTPEVPYAFEPSYETWVREVERFDITPETFLVGHSAGGGFWVRYLSEHQDLKVGRVILVAPWMDPDHTLKEDFYAFEIDSELVRRTKGITIFNSDDDSDNVHKSVDFIAANIKNVTLQQFSGYGHFTYENLGSVAFPELLDWLLSDQASTER